LYSTGQPAAFKALFCGPSKASQIWVFHKKSSKSVEIVYILGLDMSFEHKFGPQADLGCPWLVSHLIQKFYAKFHVQSLGMKTNFVD
jgi:hypothetical protein